MKKVLPVAIVVGVISLVACSSLASCGSKVYDDFLTASPKMAHAEGDYSDDPYNLGMYDSVDFVNRVVTRSTGYFDVDGLSTYYEAGSGNSNASVYYVRPAISFYSQSDFVCSTFTFCTGGTWRAVAPGEFFPVYISASEPCRLFLGFPLGYTMQQAIDSIAADGPLYFQYRLSVSTSQTFEEAMTGVSAGSAYDDGYSVGYQAGYEAGHAAGYDEGVADGYADGYAEGLEDAFANRAQGIYIQWDTNSNSNSVYNITRYVNGGNAFTTTLSYNNPTFYVDRSVTDDIEITIRASNDVPFRMTYSAVNSSSSAQTLSSDMSVNSKYYLPTWEGSVTLWVYPDDTTGDSSSYDLVFDPDSVSSVKVSNGYSTGYSVGYKAGEAVGEDAGYQDGFAAGHDSGYQLGYDAGRRVGYNEGVNSVSDGGLVVSNLFGAIVGVPISVLNGLSGLTIWSIPLISVLMSFLFLGLVIWIVRKFI